MLALLLIFFSDHFSTAFIGNYTAEQILLIFRIDFFCVKTIVGFLKSRLSKLSIHDIAVRKCKMN